jgi:tetratricopeptide (TPR) repeat protein
MPTYVLGGGLTYQQYLQAKSFSSDITSAQDRSRRAVTAAVADQTRRVIASQEALARENIRAVEAASTRVSDAVQEGFSQLSWDLQDIQHDLSGLNATFTWGFTEVLARLGQMDDSLEELVHISKNPVQTVAFNHFDIARQALRQGLHREALDEVRKAIDGDHSSPGYKLEWRFHMLRGTTLLGSIGGDLDVIDLPKSEESFLLAARYAKTDAPKEAARAFVAAGWSAYCQGRLAEALNYTQQAQMLDAELGEALFQTAKIRMAIGEPDRGLADLAGAIDHDKIYALKAADDGDFQRYGTRFVQFLEALRQEKARTIRNCVAHMLNECDLLASQLPRRGLCCPNCGVVPAPGAAHCTKCSAPCFGLATKNSRDTSVSLARGRYCSTCGSVLKSQAQFCIACGGSACFSIVQRSLVMKRASDLLERCDSLPLWDLISSAPVLKHLDALRARYRKQATTPEAAALPFGSKEKAVDPESIALFVDDQQQSGGGQQPVTAAEAREKIWALLSDQTLLASTEVRYCIGCGSGLKADAQFCSTCGTPVSGTGQYCQSCGAAAKKGSLFCGRCGTPSPRSWPS